MMVVTVKFGGAHGMWNKEDIIESVVSWEWEFFVEQKDRQKGFSSVWLRLNLWLTLAWGKKLVVER